MRQRRQTASWASNNHQNIGYQWPPGHILFGKLPLLRGCDRWLRSTAGRGFGPGMRPGRAGQGRGLGNTLFAPAAIPGCRGLTPLACPHHRDTSVPITGTRLSQPSHHGAPRSLPGDGHGALPWEEPRVGLTAAAPAQPSHGNHRQGDRAACCASGSTAQHSPGWLQISSAITVPVPGPVLRQRLLPWALTPAGVKGRGAAQAPPAASEESPLLQCLNIPLLTRVICLKTKTSTHFIVTRSGGLALYRSLGMPFVWHFTFYSLLSAAGLSKRERGASIMCAGKLPRCRCWEGRWWGRGALLRAASPKTGQERAPGQGRRCPVTGVVMPCHRGGDADRIQHTADYSQSKGQ